MARRSGNAVVLALSLDDQASDKVKSINKTLEASTKRINEANKKNLSTGKKAIDTERKGLSVKQELKHALALEAAGRDKVKIKIAELNKQYEQAKTLAEKEAEISNFEQ